MIAADFAFIDTSQSQSMCSKICSRYTEFLIKKICCRQSGCALQGYNKEVRLLVLDEVIGACNTGVFDEGQLIDFLKNKPQSLEVVLSGRNPSSALLDLADYVSEVCKRKHPFDNGIAARVGIEK